jgi:hypothetical protein
MTAERWRKIEQLYHAALEGGRGVLAGVDPELKREVERLLAAAPTGQGLLDMPAAELLPESSAALPPTQPGPYVMVSKIGRGGMGEVWKARDSRLNRDVAIKISSEQFTDRFEREARSIAALDHSNICTLRDVGPNLFGDGVGGGSDFGGADEAWSDSVRGSAGDSAADCRGARSGA